MIQLSLHHKCGDFYLVQIYGKKTNKKIFYFKNKLYVCISKINIMSTATKTKVEFDIFKTIYVIENDKVLNDIFKTDVSKLSYNIVRNLEKQGTLPKAIGEALEEMFNVIVKNPSLLRKYNKVTEDDLDVECKVPKHYGKERILADIEANGGKSELDRAMLALNDFRNVYSKLKNRAIKDKTLGTKNLNREACRDIIATVRLVENKLGHILNKK